jgi:hypothetical protein
MELTMKTETYKGEITTFLGKKIVPALKYDGNFNAFTSADEIRLANEWPTEKEVIEWRNAERKAVAVSKSRAQILEDNGYEKPAANDPVVVFAGMVKTLKLAGKSEKAAVKQAQLMLGYNADGYVLGDDGQPTDVKATAQAETADE